MLSKANLIRTVAGFTFGAFLGFTGCDDKGVTRITTYPTVTIQTPSDGDELVEDVLVLMKGLVVDDSFADELETLIPVWSVDGEQVCTDSTIDVNGETLCSHSFDAKEEYSCYLRY